MRSEYKSYNHLDSYDRMDTILDESDNAFEELSSIPSEDKLTYSNGFYVKCSALFIDIRGSSKLPQTHNRPKLAKLYRVYISEVVAILNDNVDCKRIDIVGDGISSIFDTPSTWDIDRVFSTAAQIASMIDIMNFKFEKRDITQVTVGIGMAWGRALMIKAGYKGSGINDVVWMGDVVNLAAKLCSYGNQTFNDRRFMVSDDFYTNLEEENQKLLQRNQTRGCYHGNVVNLAMNQWLEEQRNKSRTNLPNTYWR